MDHFRIGAILQTALHTYTHSARQTGRTQSLVDRVKSGDLVIVLTPAEANHMRHRLQTKGVQANVVNTNPSNLTAVRERLRDHTGEAHFDHTWVEAFHLDAINQASERIEYLRRSLSKTPSEQIEAKFHQ